MNKEYWFNMFMTLFWVLGIIVIKDKGTTFNDGLIMGLAMILAVTQLDKIRPIKREEEKGEGSK